MRSDNHVYLKTQTRDCFKLSVKTETNRKAEQNKWCALFTYINIDDECINVIVQNLLINTPAALIHVAVLTTHMKKAVNIIRLKSRPNRVIILYKEGSECYVI